MAFASEPLSERHDCSGFDSGQPALDRWLIEYAAHAENNRTVRTFVWCEDDGTVVAYYSLAAHVIARDDLPARIGRGSPYEIPAILIAKLALAVSLHGQGLGGALLVSCLRRVLTAGAIVGARMVVVDAIDETAADFYRHFEFVDVPDPESLRLVRKMSDIAASL